jgi:hypothetical protein
MAHHYRHVIPFNPESLICNHRMFDVLMRQNIEPRLLAGILNSTVVALWKTFYGRFTGTEGSLDTEVIDVRALEVPDPRTASPGTAKRIREAFDQLAKRPIGRLVEEQLMDCHSPEHARVIASGPLTLADELRQPDRRALDDAVFELLGAADPERRRELVDRLFAETAQHFRKIRVVKIQKQEQRSKTGVRRFTVDDLAADVWEAADLSDWRPLLEWLSEQREPKQVFTIPDGDRAYLMPASDMYDRNVVFFGKGRGATRIACNSREQAELLARLASVGLRGSVSLPKSQQNCRECLDRVEARLAHARKEFEALAESRGGNEKTRGEVLDLLMHWFVHGCGEQQQPNRQGVAAERG